MTDIKTQLSSYLEGTPEVTLEQIMASRRPADVPELAQIAGSMSWRGPVIAAGTAAAILLIVTAVMLSLGTSPDSGPVVEQPAPATTVADIGAFEPHILSAPHGAEWPTGDPLGGLHHAVAYIDSIDRIIIFGGGVEGAGDGAGFVANDQTLLVDLATLTVERIDTPGPPARSFHALAYDRQSDRVILFGGAPTGFTGDNDLGDTWAFNPQTETWKQMHPVEAPPPSSFHDIAYHPELDRIVLIRSEVWTYDYETNTWVAAPHWRGPPWHGYLAGSAVVDEATGTVVTVSESNGSCGPLTRTTDLDTGMWNPDPFWNLPRSCESWNTYPDSAAWASVASAVYDPATRRVIGYGISDQEQTGVILAYDAPTHTWTRLGNGPEISRVPMVYDPMRDQIVIFGSEHWWEEWTIWTTPIRPIDSDGSAPTTQTRPSGGS